MWQRRALRLAVHYLRDTADADDAVQDAFVKLYGHMTSYRADLPFDAWFTRILVNACLDRAKARTPGAALAAAAGRRRRAPGDPRLGGRRRPVAGAAAARGRQVAGAGGGGRDAARPGSATCSCSCHLDEQSPHDVATTLGMSPATVRVHLFRALRKLRTALGGPL